MNRHASALVITTFVVIAGILSAHQLFDPDLGWHLAAGRWMVLQLQVPINDPFGVDARPWIDYSWLPQLIFWGTYNNLGFPGLLALQTGLCCLAAALGGAVIGIRGRRREEIVRYGLLLLFLFPIFHLRPQLISLILFEWLLLWRRKPARRLPELGLMLVLWVNTHVYWIFGPLLVLWDRRNKRECALALVAGSLSPYGLRNFVPIYQYAFEHSHAKAMIREFQSLFEAGGYLLPLSVLLLIWVLLRRDRRDIVPTCGLCALAFYQMKFAPLFGVSAVCNPEEKEEPVALRSGLFAALFCCVAVPLALPDALRPGELDLMNIGEMLSFESGAIANTFDDGGWLEFGLNVTDPDGAPGVRTLIDGRTLVMGRSRLVEYHLIMLGQASYCAFAAKAQARYVITKKALHTLDRLENEGCSTSSPLYSGDTYELRALTLPVLQPG